jgi:tRNA dimethylallyltransferase
MQKIATIIGTTGVGKSQLGVELCKALGGQIINADAMQVNNFVAVRQKGANT